MAPPRPRIRNSWGGTSNLCVLLRLLYGDFYLKLENYGPMTTNQHLFGRFVVYEKKKDWGSYDG